MKSTNRALRRHHRQRLIAKMRRHYTLSWMPEDERLDAAKRLYNNRKVCSCWMCGHRHKWFGPTVQERRWPSREDFESS